MEIIPGLPDDISRECLLRVSLTSHYKLACVCKTWKEIVYNPIFYQDRKRFGLSQELIILPCWGGKTKKGCRIKLYDPLERSCETLPPFPPEFPYFSGCFNCVPFNHKLFVMGLLSDSPEFTNHKALIIYDFSSGTWNRGLDLPDCRVDFCCSVDSAKGLLYIAGGCNSDEDEDYDDGLRTAAVYDVEEEKWEYLPPMIWSEYKCHSVFTDDKFYVMSHVEGHIQAYDPNTRQWSAISTCYEGSMQPSFAAFGRIYYDCDGEIIEWDYVDNQFRLAGTLVPQLYRFIGGVMWNQQILMVGFNTENAMAFYLFEPSIPREGGKEDNWTLISTLSATELPDPVATIGALTFSG
ncbi:hypothetical protein SUGI_0224820 [Cryptomeria japonica]|uniref:F-box/kelch-repeat protein At1g55270-like n=1 Tax=Cryptomeria japonica TaxID=3369 RepID=UPI002408D8FA|nr:F-box/kelch-repeat protein At1g55270-like [Cryptomeria japonica]GLJ14056.1 hypothetical protein SUGI_0224820 [Cryptomeria japonica]